MVITKNIGNRPGIRGGDRFARLCPVAIVKHTVGTYIGYGRHVLMSCHDMVSWLTRSDKSSRKGLGAATWPTKLQLGRCDDDDDGGGGGCGGSTRKLYGSKSSNQFSRGLSLPGTVEVCSHQFHLRACGWMDGWMDGWMGWPVSPSPPLVAKSSYYLSNIEFGTRIL
jgi:hypothetical protein